MKRAGFTMIELIFVIVILGILAAVAIPKLAATRTDAEVSKLATNIAAAQSEIATYVVSSGTVDFSPANGATFKTASNVITSMSNEATPGNFVSFNGDTATIFDGKGSAVGTDDCITIQVDDTNTSNVLLVTQHATGTSAICKGVQSIVKESNSSIAGNRVSY